MTPRRSDRTIPAAGWVCVPLPVYNAADARTARSRNDRSPVSAAAGRPADRRLRLALGQAGHAERQGGSRRNRRADRHAAGAAGQVHRFPPGRRRLPARTPAHERALRMGRRATHPATPRPLNLGPGRRQPAAVLRLAQVRTSGVHARSGGGDRRHRRRAPRPRLHGRAPE